MSFGVRFSDMIISLTVKTGRVSALAVLWFYLSSRVSQYRQPTSPIGGSYHPLVLSIYCNTVLDNQSRAPWLLSHPQNSNSRVLFAHLTLLKCNVRHFVRCVHFNFPVYPSDVALMHLPSLSLACPLFVFACLPIRLFSNVTFVTL